jgi:two-component system KDP operon response regulator KdpE
VTNVTVEYPPSDLAPKTAGNRLNLSGHRALADSGDKVSFQSFARLTPPTGATNIKGTILLVDDDAQIRRVMVTALGSQGYKVKEAGSGEEALELIQSHKFDLLLLDVNLPGKSGIAICKEISAKFAAPIIMLTVCDTQENKVEALDAGASDYVTKPFGMREMFARIRAVLRREPSGAGSSTTHLRFDNIEINFEARRLTVSGVQVRLTSKEFDLLLYLATHANKTIPHREILHYVWGPEHDETKSLRVFVNRLRKKIEPLPHEPKYLLTEPFIGYRFEIPE